MCGLFGALSFDASAINPDHAARMSTRVARRGPDDSGQFFDGPVMLGHRRLAIIDLSASGHQPMQDVSKRYAIVFNGTIYNYPELRQILIDKDLDRSLLRPSVRRYGQQGRNYEPLHNLHCQVPRKAKSTMQLDLRTPTVHQQKVAGR